MVVIDSIAAPVRDHFECPLKRAMCLWQVGKRGGEGEGRGLVFLFLFLFCFYFYFLFFFSYFSLFCRLHNI